MTSKAYRDGYALIEWKPLPKQAPRQDKAKGPSGPFFMSDISSFVSPLDYSVISSRSTLREHERKHGVRQVGDMKPKDFDNAPRRTESFRERSFDAAYKAALEKIGL